MSKQPEALRLAELFETIAEHRIGGLRNERTPAVAAELRRLHSVNADLLAALKHCADWFNAAGHYNLPVQLQANDAIARATA